MQSFLTGSGSNQFFHQHKELFEMKKVVSLGKRKNALPVAKDLAAQAQRFLDGLSHEQTREFFKELDHFCRTLLDSCEGDLEHKLQTAYNKRRVVKAPRTVAFEIHVLMQFSNGHRNPKQYDRVRQLLAAVVALPQCWESQLLKRYG
ncbi:MAG TPA: hypothetical protein VG753_02825 [Candidatus Paceibacterota bacterium]|nr:hypothetical protein [Candidatus Paceibacterota bacterium]